jgi:hypothetical protein
MSLPSAHADIVIDINNSVREKGRSPITAFTVIMPFRQSNIP